MKRTFEVKGETISWSLLHAILWRLSEMGVIKRADIKGIMETF